MFICVFMCLRVFVFIHTRGCVYVRLNSFPLVPRTDEQLFIVSGVVVPRSRVTLLVLLRLVVEFAFVFFFSAVVFGQKSQRSARRTDHAVPFLRTHAI